MATHLQPFLKPVDCCQHLTELTFGVPMFLTVWIKNYLILHFLNSLACDTLLCPSFIWENGSVLHISHVHRCEKITTSMPKRRQYWWNASVPSLYSCHRPPSRRAQKPDSLWKELPCWKSWSSLMDFFLYFWIEPGQNLCLLWAFTSEYAQDAL